MQLQANPAAIGPIVVEDLGIEITPGQPVDISDLEFAVEASKSASLRAKLTDDAYAVGSSSVQIFDGVEIVPQGDVLEVLGLLVFGVPDEIGQVILSLDGRSFRRGVPLGSPDGWLLDDDGFLIVVG